jgi:hypothetical protein
MSCFWDSDGTLQTSINILRLLKFSRKRGIGSSKAAGSGKKQPFFFV